MIFKRIIAFIMSATLILTTPCALAEYEFSDEFDVFEQVAGYISTYYIDDSLNDSQIMFRAISEYLKDDDQKLLEMLKSMLLALDPYSEFFTKEEFMGFVNDINRTFYGIGVRIEQREGYVVITGFTQGSSAEAAGIMVGDKISKVNGEDMYGKNTNAVRNAIAGELGKVVNVTVLRDGESYTYDVARCEVNEDTVTYVKLSDEVAYISIIDMSDHTTEEFSNALEKADNDGIKNIILDLRNNGGGYLDCAVGIGRLIVPEGIIV
ncbi:MAG: PDZ domain-containing protein, partial [Clostridia bacterium]|nr:PDZ domain-containing protein [Clostridia bacterium]